MDDDKAGPPQGPDLGNATQIPGLSRRSLLGRSQSTHVDRGLSNINKYGPPDLAPEQTEVEDLRDLARFLRSTAPPRDSLMGQPEPKESRRPSLHSLLKWKTPKPPAKALQTEHSENPVPATKAGSHRRVATSIVGKRGAMGPWFRPQSLVLMPGASSQPMVGPPQWPERTTSRGALSPTFREPTPASPLGPLEKWKDELSAPAVESVASEKPEGGLLGSTYGRFGSRHDASHTVQHFQGAPPEKLNSSKTSHNSSDLRHTHDPEKLMTSVEIPLPKAAPLQLGHRTPAMSLPDITIELPTTPFMESEWPQTTTQSLAIHPQSLLDRRRQRSLSSLVVKPTLKIPEETRLPESPGFPHMLAAMTFPTPPTRSPSVSSSTSSGTPSPASVLAMPTVRPRTSSKHAVTRSGPAASLNEIVMQPTTPGSIDSISGCIPKAEHVVNTSLSLPSPPLSSPMVPDPPTPSSVETMIRPDSASSYATAPESYDASSSPPSPIFTEVDWKSAGGNTSTSTGEQKSPTTSSPAHNPTISSASTTSTTSAYPGDARGEPAVQSKSIQPADITASEFAENKISPGEDQRVLDGPLPKVLQHAHASTAAPVITTKNVGHNATTLAGRRKARNSKTTMEGERGLNTTRFDFEAPRLAPISLGDDSVSIDSPVLGWFSHNGSHRTLSLPRRSPLAETFFAPTAITRSRSDNGSLLALRNAHMSPAILNQEVVLQDVPKIATEEAVLLDVPKIANQEAVFLDVPKIVNQEAVLQDVPKIATTDPSHETSNQWKISSVMTAEIVPEVDGDDFDTPSPFQVLTISPIIIVANIEPLISTIPRAYIRLKSSSSPAILFPPPRSPLRTTFHSKTHMQQKLQPKPLPIKLPKVITTTVPERRTSIIRSRSSNRTSMPTPPQSPYDRLSKQLNLPLSSPAPNDTAALHAQSSATKRRELQSVYKPDRGAQPRPRSVVVRERFQKEKIAKEKELLELVAKTSTHLASRTSKETIKVDDVNRTKHYLENQMRTTNEIEQRIERLEQDGDAWLGVLEPLLKNMTQTLKNMKKERRVSHLLMDEFVIDMAAEARRSLYYSQNGDVTPKLGGTPRLSGTSKLGGTYFEGFDGAYQATDSTTSVGEEGRRKDRARKASTVSHLQLQLDQPTRRHSNTPGRDTHRETTDIPNTQTKTEIPQLPDLKLLDLNLSEPLRTPLEHEFAAQVTIRRHIEQQEAMMDELMGRWTTPFDNNQDLSSTQRREPRRSRRRSSSVRSGKTSESKDTDRETRAAPLGRYWTENDKKGGNNESRRHSRRWSSVGETSSLKDGSIARMDYLMRELRRSSRLSGESKWDLESVA